MRYIRKKRLAKGFVGCFLMTYMCFVLLNVMQYNIIQHIQFVYQGDEPDDIPIIREKMVGYSNDDSTMKKIAIVFALTSKRTYMWKTNESIDIHEHHLIKLFLPTFCNTASPGYAYSFYFAVDKGDEAWESLPTIFNASLNQQCIKRTISVVNIKVVHCDHNDKPAWAQNDGMMEAYIDGMEYGYRLNDDTKLASPGWTEKFINVLLKSKPPNVGVVGPGHTNNMGQIIRDDIITFDFTSSVHIDIFGFHYPKIFIDWCGDDWINEVYGPNRVTKVNDVQVIHWNMPHRYKAHKGRCKLLEDQVEHDKATLNAYIDHLEPKTDIETLHYEKLLREISISEISNSKNYGIGLSLWKNDRDFIYGTIRNIQLANLFFPNWFVRVFIPINIPNEDELMIKENVLRKMKSLGADIVYVDLSNTRIHPSLINTLIADDEDLTHFIIRDVRHRLSKCDADEVNEFINSDKSIHFKGTQMWEANRQKIITHLGGKKMEKFIQEKVTSTLRNIVSHSQIDEFMNLLLEKTEGESFNNTTMKCPNDGKIFDYYGEQPFYTILNHTTKQLNYTNNP